MARRGAQAWRLERLVEPFPASDVTSRDGAPEMEHALAGLAAADVEAIWASVEGLYQTGLHPAIALCVRRHGHVVLDRAIGHAAGNAPDDALDAELVPATPRTLFNIFSASKAVTASVIHLLDERRVLHLDDRVVEYLPEFGRHGKEGTTLRHLLTHRAGIPSIPNAGEKLDMLGDWDEIVRVLCDLKPVHRAGRQLAYHAVTGGWVLGEIVRRTTGRTIRDVLRTEICEPLGLHNLGYGVPPERVGDIARNAATGPPVVFPATLLLKRALGVSLADAITISNDPRFQTSIVPAGNVMATAWDVCTWLEMLLRGGTYGGVRVMEERTVTRAIAEQVYGEIDLTLGIPMRYSMGFVLGGRVLSIYGPGTPRAFGHLGFTTVTCYADPERDISVCLMTSGKQFLSPRLWQHLSVLRTINARCVPVGSA